MYRLHLAPHRTHLAWAALTMSAMTLGCVHSRSAVAPGGDPMVITQEQIIPLHATNAYDIVAATHANFLHSRGRESNDPGIPAIPPRVYIDNSLYGDVNSLREIGIEQIEEIRLYQSYDAQYKFGTGNMGGVIQVITKR
jgi:hypothetical protein